MSPSTVFVIDDDRAVLKAVTRLLRASGYSVEAFDSPLAFLRDHDHETPGCLVLDVAMPELDGLELQERMASIQCACPIVFISGASDIPKSVRAMKSGAVDFLPKPFDDAQLLAAVEVAMEKDRLSREQRLQAQAVHRRLATLTARELEVLEQVIAGKLNKQIASVLGTTEKTIKVHRARVMRKMGASSIVELVRITERAGTVRDFAQSPTLR
jgi:FixJ family two-component response regulator